MIRCSPEAVLAEALFELAEFVAELWPMCDGDPGTNANLVNFEIEVGLIVDVLTAVPPVLRRAPGLVDVEAGRDSGLVMAVLDGRDTLWVTPDGRVLGSRGQGGEQVRLDRTRLSSDVPGFGSVDRERDAWPSTLTAVALLLRVADGPLLRIVREASAKAAAQIESAIAAYERSTWLDEAIRAALARGERRQAIVDRLQPGARTDVGEAYDLAICEEVMTS